MLNFSLSSEQKLQRQMFICKIKSSQDSWLTKFLWFWRRHSSKSSSQLIMYKYENANVTHTLISSHCQSKTDEINSWTKTDLMFSWSMWKISTSNIISEFQISIKSLRITLSSSLKMKRMKTWTYNFISRYSTFFQNENLWKNYQRIMFQLTFQNLMLSWLIFHLNQLMHWRLLWSTWLMFHLNQLMHWRLSWSTWMHSILKSRHIHQMSVKLTWMFKSLKKSLHQACLNQQFKHFCM